MTDLEHHEICRLLENLDMADNALKAMRQVQANAYKEFREAIAYVVKPGQIVPLYGRLFDHQGNPVLRNLLITPDPDA